MNSLQFMHYTLPYQCRCDINRVDSAGHPSHYIGMQVLQLCRRSFQGPQSSMPANTAWSKSRHIPNLSAELPSLFALLSQKPFLHLHSSRHSRCHTRNTHDPESRLIAKTTDPCASIHYLHVTSAMPTKMAFSHTRLKAIFSFIT